MECASEGGSDVITRRKELGKSCFWNTLFSSRRERKEEIEEESTQTHHICVTSLLFL